MLTRSERLTVLSEVDQFALYGLPDFDESQRFEYFAFTEQELALVLNRKHLHDKIFCALQLGYFKAKQDFFRFSWGQVPNEDILFISKHYFSTQPINKIRVTKHECYSQRNAIADLFDYQLWSKSFTPALEHQAIQIAQRDITPHFIALELITFMQKEKIIRPGYTTLQTIISRVLSRERKRVGALVVGMLDRDTNIIPTEAIEHKILLIRGHKVIIDADLAILYGVTTKRLNEQVKGVLIPNVTILNTGPKSG